MLFGYRTIWLHIFDYSHTAKALSFLFSHTTTFTRFFLTLHWLMFLHEPCMLPVLDIK